MQHFQLQNNLMLVYLLFQTICIFNSLQFSIAQNVTLHPHTTTPHFTVPPPNATEALFEKLEQVFGENFLKTFSTPGKQKESSSSEEFATMEDEYLDIEHKITTPSTENGSISAPTKYPIIIPSDEDIVTEIDNVIREEEEDTTDFYKSVEDISGGGVGQKTKGRITTSAHFRRTCGDRKENCEKSQKEGGRPLFLSFSRNPQYCRCDKGTCDLYGDCCWTIATTLLYRNPWKCLRVQHENTWALMVSKCSEEYKSQRNADRSLIQSCESPLSLPPSASYTHLHDIPVYSNVTNVLYRNIYCSRCNGLQYHELHHMRLLLRCSQQFNTSAEREAFISSAKYQRGKRIWVTADENADANANANVGCGIFAPELDQRLIAFTIPGLRYCKKNAIDRCPKDFVLKDPTTAALCNSYTQYVESRPGFVFKNPHCAQCYGLDPKWDLRCLKDGGRTAQGDAKITPGAAGASLDSMGLSLLFDFDLGSDGNYVGYESTCPADSIWDFLRQKCTTTMCSKDYELDQSDGTCKPKPTLGMEDGTDGSKGQDDNGSGEGKTNATNISGDDGDLDDVENNSSSPLSSCYILIVHDSEYTRLPNDSILVVVNHTHLSQLSPSAPQLIFHPGEYQVWNETSISICARDLSSSFRQRFSPILNYLSLSALGLSVFFSLLHILLFMILPKMQNLPGKNLFCLTLSLLISQLLFLCFITYKVDIVCVLASILMHYFFLSSFFWMNVMSFDIWRTFSSQFVMRHSSSGSGGLFLKYCLWGWLSPFIILTISVSIDLLDWPALRKIRPLYGHNNLCWLGQGLALFTFFALPAVILILLNILLFTFTAKAILDQSKDTEKVFRGGEQRNKKKAGHLNENAHEQCSRRSSSSEAEVQRMKLYMKLGVIMGVTWILGFLSGISEWEWMWYPFVIVNGLQGTFIFFGFDAKPKVWMMLKERLTTGEGGTDAGRNVRSANANMTSTSTPAWRRDTTTSTTSGSGGGSSLMVRTREESISRRIPA